MEVQEWRIRPRTASSALPAGSPEKKAKKDGEEDPPPPVSLRSSGSESGINDCLLALQKLCLQNAQSIKALMAANWEFAIAPASSLTATPIEVALQVGANYDKTCRERGKGHGLGAPHLHTSVAMIEAMATAPSLEQGETANTIKILASFLAVMSQPQVDQLIPYWSVRKARQSKDPETGAFVQWTLHPLALLPWELPSIQEALPQETAAETMEMAKKYTLPLLRAAIRSAVVSTCAAKMTSGTPPRSQLERVVQGHLQTLQKKS